MTSAGSDALSAARELLPAWVVWGRSLLPALVFLVQLSVAIGMIAFLGQSAGPQSDLHWTERARRAANLRGLLQWPAFLVIGIALVIAVCLRSPFDMLPGRWLPLVTLAAYLIASELGERWIRWKLNGHESTWGRWCRQVTSGTILHRAAILLAFACLVLVGTDPRPIGYVLLSLASLVILLRALARSWMLLHPIGLIREFDPEPLLGAASKHARFFEVDLGEANAIAYPRAHAIVVTKWLRELLEPRELASVLRHELGHLHSDQRSLVPDLGELGLLLCMAWYRPLLGWVGAAIAVGAVFPFLLLKARSLRSRASEERHADLHALEHCDDPQAYASALERLYSANQFPASLGEQASHPDLYDRLLTTGNRPAFPRPARTRHQGILVACLAPVFALLLAGVQHGSKPNVLDEPGALRALALGGNPVLPLAALSILHEQRGDRSGAETLRRAAQEADTQR